MSSKQINTETHWEMQVKYASDTSSIWNEKLTGLVTRDEEYREPVSDEEAIELAKMTIGFFNNTLKPGETERELVCVQRIETKVIDITDPIF